MIGVDRSNQRVSGVLITRSSCPHRRRASRRSLRRPRNSWQRFARAESCSITSRKTPRCRRSPRVLGVPHVLAVAVPGLERVVLHGDEVVEDVLEAGLTRRPALPTSGRSGGPDVPRRTAPITAGACSAALRLATVGGPPPPRGGEFASVRAARRRWPRRRRPRRGQVGALAVGARVGLQRPRVVQRVGHVGIGDGHAARMPAVGPAGETSGDRVTDVLRMLVEALAALADPIRRELVDLLAGGELAAGELADRFPVSRPAISRHLRVLREAGLVTVAHRGPAAPLRARPAPAAGARRLAGALPRPVGPAAGRTGHRDRPRTAGTERAESTP